VGAGAVDAGGAGDEKTKEAEGRRSVMSRRYIKQRNAIWLGME